MIVTTNTDRSTARVQVAPGLAIADVVTVRAEDCCGVDVEIDVVPDAGRLVAHEIRVSRREDGRAVTGEILRSVPVATLTKYAAAKVETHEQRDGYTVTSVRVLTPEGAELVRAQGPVDASLEWVAYLYRVAVLMGEPPTKTVETALGLSRATAGRWISLAREKDHLGPAEGPGKAGG